MVNWLYRSSRNQQRQAAAQRRAAERRYRKRGFEALEDRRMLAAVSWVGGAAAGPYWDVAANWSNDAVPTAADDVTINSGTPTTVTIQSGDVESVDSLTTAAGYTIAMTGGSLTIGSTSITSVLAGNFNLSGGTLGGAGNVTFDGTANWSGGTIAGSGTTDIAAGGTLNISGTVYLQGVLENDGTANWTAGGIQMVNGTINNDGSWNVNSISTLPTYGLNTSGTANAFNNEAGATFTQQGTGATQFTSTYIYPGVAFNNAGAVDVDAGTLLLGYGGTQTGGFAISAGTTLGLNGTHNFSSASALSGSGTLGVGGGTATFAGVEDFSGGTLSISGGEADFNAAATFADLNLSSGGTLGGTGNVTFQGTANWSGGTIAGSGTTDIAAGGTLNISGTVYLQGVLENDGTANWTNGSIQMYNGTINNDGSWNANSTSTLQTYGLNSGGTANAFNNDPGATFTQLGTGATYFTSTYVYPGVAFNNAGSVDVDAGTLLLGYGGTQTGGFAISAGAALALNGTHNFSSASALSGSGTLGVGGGTATFAGVEDFSGGTLSISGGEADFNAAATFADLNLSSGGTLGGTGNVTFQGTANWSGGTIAGSGTTDIAAGGTLNISGTVYLQGVLENDGTANWTNGSIQMSNGTINNDGSWTSTPPRRSRPMASIAAVRPTPSTTTRARPSRNWERVRRSSRQPMSTPAWPSTTPAPSMSTRARSCWVTAARRRAASPSPPAPRSRSTARTISRRPAPSPAAGR